MPSDSWPDYIGGQISSGPVRDVAIPDSAVSLSERLAVSVTILGVLLTSGILIIRRNKGMSSGFVEMSLDPSQLKYRMIPNAEAKITPIFRMAKSSAASIDGIIGQLHSEVLSRERR